MVLQVIQAVLLVQAAKVVEVDQLHLLKEFLRTVEDNQVHFIVVVEVDQQLPMVLLKLVVMEALELLLFGMKFLVQMEMQKLQVVI